MLGFISFFLFTLNLAEAEVAVKCKLINDKNYITKSGGAHTTKCYIMMDGKNNFFLRSEKENLYERKENEERSSVLVRTHPLYTYIIELSQSEISPARVQSSGSEERGEIATNTLAIM